MTGSPPRHSLTVPVICRGQRKDSGASQPSSDSRAGAQAAAAVAQWQAHHDGRGYRGLVCQCQVYPSHQIIMIMIMCASGIASECPSCYCAAWSYRRRHGPVRLVTCHGAVTLISTVTAGGARGSAAACQ